MKKTLWIVGGTILAFIIAGALYLIMQPSCENCIDSGRIIQEQVIGGDTDEHGCLGSAGYGWCQSSEKCLRIWEESCDDSINTLFDELKEKSSIDFEQNQDITFDWRLESSDGVEILKIKGQSLSASGVSREGQQEIEQFLESKGETNIYNLADGVQGGLRGYEIGYDVCTYEFSFVEITDHENEPSVPVIEKGYNISVRCGFLDRQVLPEISLEDQIAKAFSSKYGKKASIYQIDISSQTESHARGMVQTVDEQSGGIFIAYKKDNNWIIAHDGNGAINCVDVENLGFPEDMISDCVDF